MASSTVQVMELVIQKVFVQVMELVIPKVFVQVMELVIQKYSEKKKSGLVSQGGI